MDYTLPEQSGVPPTVARMMGWAKASNELIGLVRGLLADGVLARSEADFLRQWVNQRVELVADPVIGALARRILRIYQDEVVTDDELTELRDFLSELSRNDGVPTSIAFPDPLPQMRFSGMSFCFTGNFAYGKRKECWFQTVLRGAEIHPKVTHTTDFLIVGSAVSKAWANQTYGRKIEEAMARQHAGWPLVILPEAHWILSLDTTPVVSTGADAAQIRARIEDIG
jgi:NAD-dependent DNA ligase